MASAAHRNLDQSVKVDNKRNEPASKASGKCDIRDARILDADEPRVVVHAATIRRNLQPTMETQSSSTQRPAIWNFGNRGLRTPTHSPKPRSRPSSSSRLSRKASPSRPGGDTNEHRQDVPARGSCSRQRGASKIRLEQMVPPRLRPLSPPDSVTDSLWSLLEDDTTAGGFSLDQDRISSLDNSLESIRVKTPMPLAKPSSKDAVVSGLICRHESLATALNTTADRCQYFTYELDNSLENSLGRPPQGHHNVNHMLRSVFRAADEKDKEQLENTVDQEPSYIIWPVYTQPSQTVCWLSVAHVAQSKTLICEARAFVDDTHQDMQNEHVTPTPWWDVLPGKSVLNRTIAKGDTRREPQLDPEEIHIPVSTVLGPKTVADTNVQTQRSRLLSLFSRNIHSASASLDLNCQQAIKSSQNIQLAPLLSILPTSIRRKIWQLLHGNTSQTLLSSCITPSNSKSWQSSSLRHLGRPYEDINNGKEDYPLASQKENGSPIDFLKLTPAQKKAFYSSPGMNRIAAATSARPTRYVPPHRRDVYAHENVVYGDSFDAQPMSLDHPQMALAAFEAFCLLASLRTCRSKTVTVLISWPYGETGGFDGDETKFRAMENQLRKWEKATRALPWWVEALRVKGEVP